MAASSKITEEEKRRMRVVVYSAQPFERKAFRSVLDSIPPRDLTIDLVFVMANLSPTSTALAHGARALCLFVRDRADASILRVLHRHGVELLALRYAGRSTVDLETAAELGIHVARVPTHSPGSIAEYAVTLMLALNRKIHLAANRIRTGDPSLHGLLGFALADQTIGVIGTGQVGRRVVRILRAFGARVLAFDAIRAPEIAEMEGVYVPLERLLRASDVITLHAPLVPATRHLICAETLQMCKRGVHIINTARGALIDAGAVVESLRSGHVGALGIDVFEGETELLFTDNTSVVIDSALTVLKSLPNVIVTGHQGSLTTGAIDAMAKATVHTLRQFHAGEKLDHEIFK